MKKFTNFTRTIAGKKSVLPYYRAHASKKAKTLDDVYHCVMYEFNIEKNYKK